MSLTGNDKKWGPFTWGPWTKTFSIKFDSGDDEYPGNTVRLIGFGQVLQLALPQILKPAECGEFPREYGITLSDMGNGYDFMQLHFGPQTHDSTTTRKWCKHLPWKMWNCFRHSLYDAGGSHVMDCGKDWNGFFKTRDNCAKMHFQFLDYDEQKIIATCHIEEREWSRGEGLFKWLKWFYPNMIRRVLEMSFNEETGTEKGSWKGGTIGTSIDMISGDTAESAFRRYCEQEHRAKGRNYQVKYVGPCGPPLPKPIPCHSEDQAAINSAILAKN